ncbi:MAG TPA: DUF721 domain-containing protein [Pseudobdellovibrionaceae bacterium]|nr:DUF721 domain-containing protein [Pseudobdellovibrionaceae bacterium]
MPLRKKPLKKHFANGSEVLLNLFHGTKSPLSHQFLKWKLWSQWKQVVGPTISSQTEPLRIYNGKLTIWVKNSTWLHQLNFMKDPIIESIDRRFQSGFVKEVYFTLSKGDMESIPKSEVLDNMDRIEQLKGKKE